MSKEILLALAVIVLGLMGAFFMALNPSEEATTLQMVWGMAWSKGAMALCWYGAARAYRGYLRELDKESI